ncbi:hypothetical protein [Micromonospora sp. CA-246542]|uniref:hypothetical protein n=1 Tax=Micromonospora sp. CA-246542 TaxID=3239959 RepID=UPI003D8FB580
MNDQTTGTPKRHPATTDPRPLMDFVDGEDIDAAGRAALDEIQRRFEETWDIKAGLQEILLTEHYHRAVTSPESTFDVKAGLAAIVGPPPLWVQFGVDRPLDPTADGGFDLTATDNDTCEVYLVDVNKHHYLPTPPDTLQQIASVAHRILTVLELVIESDPMEFHGTTPLAQALSIAYASANRLYALPAAIEDRVVTREQAVQVVESAGSACEDLRRRVHERTLNGGKLPRDLVGYEEIMLGLSHDAYGLRVPVQRLFDPSDDLVDTLL